MARTATFKIIQICLKFQRVCVILVLVIHTLLFTKECLDLKKRADGRYCKQILLGYYPDGRRKMKTIYGTTIKEVEKKERECRNMIEQGIVEENNITVCEWSEMWLKTYKANVSYNTYQMYSNALQNHINPVLGDILLKNVKTIQIQQLINQLTEKGNSRSAEIVRLTVKQFMHQALDEGYIYKDVVGGVKAVKHQSKEKRTLTDIEKTSIQKADLTAKQRVFLDIMLYTGLRRGEVLALTTDDINLSDKMLTVNKSLYFEVNNANIKEPKSKAGYRQIPIPDRLIDELMAYILSLENNILFTMNNGNYMTKSSFRKFWDGIISSVKRSAENPNDITFTPHIFRHTYATNLYYAGVDIKTAQYFLGHSSLSMTLEIYTHLDKQHINSEIDKLNKYLVSQKSVNG